MKHQITREQLNELSVEEQNKFMKWVHEECTKYTPGDAVCLPDIGMMIEFLGDSWVEKLTYLPKMDGIYISSLPNNENLCNVLWEHVQDKLNK